MANGSFIKSAATSGDAGRSEALSLLILDEATANIDTATEALLESVLTLLPSHTTRVIIAHRLNTIENADVIFFVNAGKIQQAGSFEDALRLLLSGTRKS